MQRTCTIAHHNTIWSIKVQIIDWNKKSFFCCCFKFKRSSICYIVSCNIIYIKVTFENNNEPLTIDAQFIKWMISRQYSNAINCHNKMTYFSHFNEYKWLSQTIYPNVTEALQWGIIRVTSKCSCFHLPERLFQCPWKYSFRYSQFVNMHNI